MIRHKNQGTADTGLHHVGKVAGQANCIFQTIDQKNDVGIDGWIELVDQGSASGYWVALQIKSGTSFVSDNNWRIPVDEKHANYWRSHVLPVCGVVYDPLTDTARWVDISEELSERPMGKGGAISVPVENLFDFQNFGAFQTHFSEYHRKFSEDGHFGRTLRQFARVDQIEQCDSSMKALFSFHRERPETWYFLVSCLPNFQSHPLIRRMAFMLCHIPGHGDIWWHPKNEISGATRSVAKSMLDSHLSRDGVIALLGAIDSENGIMRGSIGQCVSAIVGSLPRYFEILSSVILDVSIPSIVRYWALVLLVFEGQFSRLEEAKALIRATKENFDEDEREHVAWILRELEASGYVDFT